MRIELSIYIIIRCGWLCVRYSVFSIIILKSLFMNSRDAEKIEQFYLPYVNETFFY